MAAAAAAAAGITKKRKKKEKRIIKKGIRTTKNRIRKAKKVSAYSLLPKRLAPSLSFIAIF